MAQRRAHRSTATARASTSALTARMGTPWTSAKAVIRRADPASQHPVIQQIAKKYGKHPLHIIMRWGLQHGTSILAKSSNPDRIKVSHCPAILHPSRKTKWDVL